MDYTFLSTVEINKSCFHLQSIKVADEVRVLQQLVVLPSTQTLKTSVQNNQIRNFLITTDDISRAEVIYRTHIPIIQGKSIRISIYHHRNIPRIPFPLS